MRGARSAPRHDNVRKGNFIMLRTRIVDYCDTFPSISHPYYAEIKGDEGHIYYYDAFKTYEEMEDKILNLFCHDRIVFHKMRTKKR